MKSLDRTLQDKYETLDGPFTREDQIYLLLLLSNISKELEIQNEAKKNTEKSEVKKNLLDLKKKNS